MKVKAGPLFKRISPVQDYHRLGKENWEKLEKGGSVDIDSGKELVDKGYLVESSKSQKPKEAK
tara:strand:- start:68 stop:256 length:189 start_codon:yes stop_codon:yes gene_type:complete